MAKYPVFDKTIAIHDKTTEEQIENVCDLLSQNSVPFALAFPVQAEIDADNTLTVKLYFCDTDTARVEGAIMLALNTFPKWYRDLQA